MTLGELQLFWLPSSGELLRLPRQNHADRRRVDPADLFESQGRLECEVPHLPRPPALLRVALRPAQQGGRAAEVV